MTDAGDPLAGIRRRHVSRRSFLGGGAFRLGVRTRVALVAALAVAAAVVVSSAVVFVVVRHDLIGTVDAALEHHANLLQKRRAQRGALAGIEPPHRGRAALGTAPILAQVVTAGGTVAARAQVQPQLPVDPAVLAVAAGHEGSYFTGATVGTAPVRMLVTPFGPGYALEEIRPISEIDADLGRLATVLIVTSAAGVVTALLLGAGVAGVALRPVRRLTHAAERVASTRDLAQEIHVGGSDELARLAASINTMLGALDASQRAQRQLVADASHELRTPLTSLHTNVEVLAEAPQMDPAARHQLVTDLAAQLDAISRLLADLVELARHDDRSTQSVATEPVPLDAIVDEGLLQAGLNHPTIRFRSSSVPAETPGVATDLQRMVTNLLDNAAKWSPPGGTVEVSVALEPAGAPPYGTSSSAPAAQRSAEMPTRPGPGRKAGPGPGRQAGGRMVVLGVSDHGPGIATEDLPHIFDRFYRGRGARQLPGSGLGLAIVHRIVDEHGGDVHAEPVPGGGARIVVRLPWEPGGNPDHRSI